MRKLVAILFTLVLSLPAHGIFIRVDVEKVPVARLAENLEKLAKDEPKKVEHLLNLGRVYAMAYSKKVDEVEVDKKSPSVPWLGYAPKQVPFSNVQKTEDKEKLKAAEENLKKALTWYEAALKLEPENVTARIGHAWATQQAGKKDEAIKLYRKLIADAWEKTDSKLQVLGLNGETITTEAGGYLLELLDSEKDKDEIADLKDKIAKLRKLPRPVTPIVIPLEDNLSLKDIEAPKAQVNFDADGTGLQREWTWISPQAAWLVYDAKGNGDVNSGLQLFGNVTFRLFWSNGYEALRSLDDNRDGEISGEELNKISLWHDANSNGKSDPGEVKPLSEYGIVKLSTQYERMKDHADKIAFSVKGVTFKDGKTRPTYDVILKAK